MQNKLCKARFPISRVLIWNATSHSVRKEREKGNQVIFDSYTKREEKQNTYQLLRINLAILVFQFQE